MRIGEKQNCHANKINIVMRFIALIIVFKSGGLYEFRFESNQLSKGFQNRIQVVQNRIIFLQTNYKIKIIINTI